MRCLRHAAIGGRRTQCHGLTRRMARRRPRGTRIDPVSMTLEVERTSKSKFEEIARTSGVSGSVMFELLVAHVELTDQGIPVWMPETNRPEELPIKTT